MRAPLGEILVREKLITPAQLESALNAQVIFGGRLGTNLVELCSLELDALARALAIQFQVPAALQKHFDQIQPAAVQLVSAKLAQKHSAIPLGLTAKAPKSLAVAFMSPSPAATDEVAFAAGCRLTVTVAPELRVLHFLEKLYGIPRKVRYLRLMDESAAPPKVERRVHAQLPVEDDSPFQPPSGLSSPEADLAAAYPRMTPPAAPYSTPFGSPEPPVPPSGPGPRAPPVRSAAGPAPATSSPPHPAPMAPVGSAAPAARPALSAPDALSRIGAASSRDDIGDAIVDHLRSAFSTGLVLIVREEMALGWKGFSFGAEPSAIESIAVPLGAPSMFQQALARRTLFRGAPPLEGAALQSRLWKLLKCAPPQEAGVFPVMLKERPVLLVAALPVGGGVLPDDALADLVTVCSSAATAFVRLIQQAKARSGG